MQNKRVIVGMSGGVDSSVTALLMQKAGYEVEGLFMFNWSEDELGRCSAASDCDDAAAVCQQLGIELHRADFSKEYKDRVFKYFLDSYAAGRTPNPDILCNREIKFKVFLDYAQRLGADAVATGHYARIDHSADEPKLLRGIDPGKDQSYFLAAVPSKALKNVFFPLGELEKTQVREIAKQNGLLVHNKPDSTGVCFIGERDFEGFLREHLAGQPGPIKVSEGPLDQSEIAQHNGLIYYTIGQRKGLGLGGIRGAADAPWFVAKKDLSENTLWVTQNANHPALVETKLTTLAPQWVGQAPTLPLHCSAQVRYRQRAISCQLYPAGEYGIAVHFDEPPRAIAAGQYVVFYDGEICLGGAEIAHAGVKQVQTA